MRLVPLVLIGCVIAEPVLARQVDPHEPTSTLVNRGVIGGVLGWVAGAVVVGLPLAVANPFNSRQLDDGSWTPGLVIGFESGQAVGIPLAVHRANGGRGDLRKSLLASFALAAVGTALLWTDDLDAVFESPRHQAVLLAIPVAQVISSIYFERRTR